MYLATRATSDPLDGPPLVEGDPVAPRGWLGVQPNVVMLGLTSLLTDVSSEMVASVLPIYFVLQLGFSPLQFGAFDGVYQGLAAVLCIAAAVVADRRQRHKRVAELGYGLSALSRLGLVLASGAWVPLVGFLYVDRLGKGIRTAPRDALISLSSTRDRLAASFGVHRALDTTGAVLGPLVGAYLLARNPAGFDVVFMTSFFIAVIGIGVMVCFVHEVRARPADAPSARPVRPPTARAAVALLRRAPFRRVAVVATLLALVTPGDALLFLALERRTHLTAAYFPLLYFGASVVFLSLAIPAGRLADRIGRAQVFLGGELLLLMAFLAVGAQRSGPFVVVLVLVLLGAFYAGTDGVLMAMASATLPEATRTSGLALIVTAIALGHLVAAVTFGALWSRVGPAEAMQIFAVGLSGAIVVTALVLFRPAKIPV